MKKVMIAIFTVAVILVLVGISYAYFTGRVMGDKKELLVMSKNIRIVFTDEKEISNGAITPGWSESKKFSVKNESNDVFYYNIIFENLVNTFVTEGFLQYKITSTDGGYSMSGYLDIPKSSTPTDIILALNIELPIDVTHNYTVEFVYHNSDTVNQNDDQGKIFEGNLFITEGEKVSNTLADKLKSDYKPKPGRTDFSVIDDSEPALYTDEDDQGTTYYFSGDGTDMRNWVSFAGKLWRVIRINGNGSVRLLYAGTGGRDGYIGNPQPYNTSSKHPGYVGWKYSLGNSLDEIRRNENKSDAYTTVETWYNALSSTDKNYIDVNAIYCNDRTIRLDDIFSISAKFYYISRTRIFESKTPTFRCSNTSDQFNIFGLMTADEILYAGGVYVKENPKAYYYLNLSGGSATGDKYWWTMTPHEYDNSLEYKSYILLVEASNSPGYLSDGSVHYSNVIRPVVSLKAEVEVIGGDGSSSNPYTVSYTPEVQTLRDKIKTAYPPKTERIDFATIDDGTPGLYTGEDDQGPTYYFSGNGSQMNNWVKYAGKYWRIIRINGNGSVRMLYAGDGSSASDIGTSAFNSSYNHPSYVGWKYTKGGSLSADRGNSTKSTIYGVVENWYNNLGITNQNYLDTSAIYCSDRELASGSSYSTSSGFNYAAYGRLAATKGTPTFKCSNASDRFTGSNSMPVGLMTADEVVAAGGLWVTNSPKAYYYLAKDGSSSITGSSWWWTMSPYSRGIAGSACVFYVRGSGSYPGRLGNLGVPGIGIVRPVVSLKAEVLVTGGSGTGIDPYTVVMP